MTLPVVVTCASQVLGAAITADVLANQPVAIREI
jgi:hypothetical protein